MAVVTLNTIFTWVGIIAACLTVVSVFGTWWTGRLIDKEKDTKITELQIKVAATGPRALNDEQKSKLVPLLSQKEGKIGFIVKALDGESKNYAEQLSEVFKLAGWEIMPPRYDLLDDFSGKINIFMTGRKKDKDVNVSIVSAFTPFDQIGIPYQSEVPRDGSFVGRIEEDTLYIEVGAK